MSEPTPQRGPARPVTRLEFSAPGGDDRVCCERCGAQMSRRQAIWHCLGCGHKTDCCGW